VCARGSEVWQRRGDGDAERIPDMNRLPARVGIVLLALVLVACAPDASNAARIAVELADDSITLDPGEVGAGRVVFDTLNVSTGLVHEIEVFEGGSAGAILPVDNTVADTNGLRLIDEVEDVVPGASASLAMDVRPGTYLIICNLPGHYTSGMWAYLTVGDN